MDFLADDQLRGYGRFRGDLSQSQLDRFFLLDHMDRRMVERHRRDHQRLGFAMQLGTVRFLGTFLSDPLDVPWQVVECLAEQLRIRDPSCVKRYGKRVATQHAHAREIREALGYREFADVAAELRRWLEARAWTQTDRPSVLFDRATGWLLEHKVLLPGATVLARVVVSVRESVTARLWDELAAEVDVELANRLERLLLVEPGSRLSTLERLRKAPTRVSAPEMVRALDRLAEIRGLGAGHVDVSGLPAGRVGALARYGMGAKAQALSRLTTQRRRATLLAVVARLETTALDDVLDLFDVLAAQLLSRAEKASEREQVHRLPRLSRAAGRLADAVQVMLNSAEDTAVAQMWADIERVVSRRRESHPPPLVEPCVTLSRHTAPVAEPVGSAPCRQWMNRPGSLPAM